ncbi:SRPBCC family protein [Neobacillus drentensis]|uniref:SRPBCC family protein n=1 Tax=Neobacillus drentensis TaxID=220684 RepID=UPI0030012E9B
MLNENLTNSATMNPEKSELVITRTFNAPRELVFKVWTEPEHLKHWWGPKGFALDINKFELRPDGIFHYRMRSEDGHEMWGKFIYREIISPEKLVFINSFSDEEGNTVRAPFSPIWPLEILNTLTLSENEGKTTITLRGGPINASEEERKRFVEEFESMKQGFGGTFDQLHDYLAMA